jgi:hypothetical protein
MSPNTEKQINDTTSVPLRWVLSLVVGGAALTMFFLGLQRAYYNDGISTEAKINKAVSQALIDMDQKRSLDQADVITRLKSLSDDNKALRMDIIAIQTRFARDDARSDAETNNRYTAIQAASNWREAERLNTWDNLQKYGFRSPDVWVPTSPWGSSNAPINAIQK